MSRKQDIYTDAAIGGLIKTLNLMRETNKLLEEKIDLVRELHDSQIARLERRITKLEEK
jgi:hypothetical protein